MKMVQRIAIAIIDVVRPFLGSPYVCIYETTGESCSVYAKRLIAHEPLGLACLRIGVRLLSCNPLTVLFWWLRSKF